ncbi:MAG: DUF4912 domain-containing protein [Bacillota bacterium]
MLWFYALVVAAVALAIWFYRERLKVRPRAGARERTLTETSAEIGAPPEAVDPEKALLSDRLAGVERPRASLPLDAGHRSEAENQDEGSLGGKELRKANLSKEVEVDWEAADLIKTQPGAYAWPRDFIDEPSKGFLRKTGETDALKESSTGRNEAKQAGQRQFREGDYVLPDRYGKERLVLMARDPRWLYAYWEVASDRYQELRSRRLEEWGLSKPVLRLYDLSEESPSHRVVDVELRDDAENWYVRLNRPRHRLVAEIGRIFPDGFVPLLRSNEVLLPPDSPSMEISEEWAPVDWEGKYGRFAGAVGVSSPGVWGR